MERRAPRYTVWLPVRVAELPGGVAVSHNASGRGMLLVTAEKLEIGAPVHIVVQFPPDAKSETRVQGRVVRVEPNEEDPDGLWPHRLAVEFDEPVPELQEMLALLAQDGLARSQH